MNAAPIRNGFAWARYIKKIVIPDVKLAHRWVTKFALPTFDRFVEDKTESELHTSNAEEYGHDFEDDDRDAWFGGSVGGLEQGVLNLLFVHLFHLLEQQLAQLVSKAGERSGFTFKTTEELLQCAFETFGFDPTYLNSWPHIEELRRIANTVKHYDANDSTKLKSSHPEWFASEDAAPLVRLKPEAFPVQTAMAGMDLYMRPEHYDAKVEAVVEFWEEFAQVLRGDKPKPKSVKDFVFENRDKILTLAAKHKATNVRVFGSVARGDAGPASDVDLLVDFQRGTSFGEEDSLRRELESLLGRKVDLGTFETLKPRLKERAQREAIPL